MRYSLNMSEKLTIYYDGSCGFCRRQIDKIRLEDKQKLLQFVATNASQYLHLQDEQGHLYHGADAFGKIWSVTEHPVLSLLCNLPVSKQIARIIYRLIAKYRHFLNRNQDSCDL